MKKAKKPGTKQTSALVISPGGKTPLSKHQQAFNKLTVRIEKLQADIAKKARQFDEALALHSKQIIPLEEELAQQSRRLLTLLFPYYHGHRLKNRRPLLKELLQFHLQNVLDHLPGEPDDEVKHIFQHLEGERYEDAAKREEKEAQAEMEDVFKMWGVDVDIDGTDMTDEAMAEKMAEAQAQMKQRLEGEQQRAEQRRKARPKTAKQVEREKAQQAADEMKQKSLSTLYRQLAKLLHPDLEQDEVRRAEKAVLMQEVPRAYEDKDLHALLLLELRWMQNEQSHLETVADEKLGLYLQILREQAAELERQKWQLLNHPRYRVLVQHYGYRPLSYPLKAVTDEQRELAHFNACYREDIASLQTPQALHHLKTMLDQWKRERPSDDENDLLSALMAFSRR